ncbi:extracellular solute-binding protein [Cohnella cellulosilytica]|uniref:Extracellular solute-binding protein n=1 Tax=Cohnella cellulosilytica TaxID=986710 RepID=A0ABW2F4Z8_9BACL
MRRKDRIQPGQLANLLLCTFLLGGLLAACSGKTETGSSGNANPAGSSTSGGKPQSGDFDEPYKLTIMLDNFTAENPPAESDAMTFLRETTKTDIDITWVPRTSYTEKLNATIASNTMPKVVVSLDIKTPAIINAIRSGVFWEIGPYLEDYPRLAAMSPVLKNNVLVDGKLYAIPRHLDLASNGFVYRSDWVKDLGMQPPATLEDVYELAKAMVHNDPDGNGKPDTYGLIEHNDPEGFDQVVLLLGGPYKWLVENDAFVPYFETPEYREALDFYKRLYDEKLVNQDFAAINKEQRSELIENGKGGMMFAYAYQITERLPIIRKTVPDADMEMGNLAGPKGERLMPSLGYTGLYLIPKSSVKTEAELKRVLQFFEDLADPRVQTFMQWGLEDVHYKMENGKPVKIDEARYQTEINILRRLKPHTMSEAPDGVNSPDVDKVLTYFKEKEDKVVGDPSLAYISDTYAERGTELTKIIEDARIKYIMGMIDENGWNDAVAEWHKKGGDKIVQEYSDQLK